MMKMETGCFVCARECGGFAGGTVMQTLLSSAWETDALLFLNFGATSVPRQKAE